MAATEDEVETAECKIEVSEEAMENMQRAMDKAQKIVEQFDLSNDPTTPEGIARYDAETVRRTGLVVAEVRDAERAWESAAEYAKRLKKDYENLQTQLVELSEERAKMRGKRPVKDLFTDVKPEPEAWRERDIYAPDFVDQDIVAALIKYGVATMGELWDAVKFSEGKAVFGLSQVNMIEILSVLKRAAESDKPKADPLAELWRDFPIKGLTEYGLTPKDVEKLAAGEIKSGGCHPIVTMGDLSAFTAPKDGNPEFSYGLKDIKGIGQAGVDRISEATTHFWKSWGEGLDKTFAAERGVPIGDESEPGNAGEDPPVEQPAETKAEPSANGKPKRKK